MLRPTIKLLLSASRPPYAAQVVAHVAPSSVPLPPSRLVALRVVPPTAAGANQASLADFYRGVSPSDAQGSSHLFQTDDLLGRYLSVPHKSAGGARDLVGPVLLLRPPLAFALVSEAGETGLTGTRRDGRNVGVSIGTNQLPVGWAERRKELHPPQPSPILPSSAPHLFAPSTPLFSPPTPHADLLTVDATSLTGSPLIDALAPVGAGQNLLLLSPSPTSSSSSSPSHWTWCREVAARWSNTQLSRLRANPNPASHATKSSPPATAKAGVPGGAKVHYVVCPDAVSGRAGGRAAAESMRKRVPSAYLADGSMRIYELPREKEEEDKEGSREGDLKSAGPSLEDDFSSYALLHSAISNALREMSSSSTVSSSETPACSDHLIFVDGGVESLYRIWSSSSHVLSQIYAPRLEAVEGKGQIGESAGEGVHEEMEAPTLEATRKGSDQSGGNNYAKGYDFDDTLSEMRGFFNTVFSRSGKFRLNTLPLEGGGQDMLMNRSGTLTIVMMGSTPTRRVTAQPGGPSKSQVFLLQDLKDKLKESDYSRLAKLVERNSKLNITSDVLKKLGINVPTTTTEEKLEETERKRRNEVSLKHQRLLAEMQSLSDGHIVLDPDTDASLFSSSDGRSSSLTPQTTSPFSSFIDAPVPVELSRSDTRLGAGLTAHVSSSSSASSSSSCSSNADDDQSAAQPMALALARFGAKGGRLDVRSSSADDDTKEAWWAALNAGGEGGGLGELAVRVAAVRGGGVKRWMRQEEGKAGNKEEKGRKMVKDLLAFVRTKDDLKMILDKIEKEGDCNEEEERVVKDVVAEFFDGGGGKK